MTKRKKILLSVTAVLIAAVILAVCIFVAMPKIPPKTVSLSEKGIKSENVNLIAHRGFSAAAPENSAVAFAKAGEAGFYAAECDIQLSKDNVWVVNHNATIDKMTDGEGKIRDMTYEEISRFNIDSGHHAKNYPNQKLITLEEYLKVCNASRIIPQIEIKEGNYDCLDDILSLLDNYKGMRESAIIISFDGVILEKLRNLDENLQLWYLTHEIEDKTIELAKLNNYTIAFNCKKYDENMLKKAQEQHINLAAWTVDSIKTYEKLYDLGVRDFTTNCITY